MTVSPLAAMYRAIAFAAACACAGSVFAQAPAAPAPGRLPTFAQPLQGSAAPAPAAPAAPALGAPKIEQAHLDLATEVLQLSGMSRSIDLIVPQMIASARNMFTRMRPEVAGEIETTIKNLDPFWKEQAAFAIRLGAESFALSLNEADLKELKTFFSSEVGKKFVASQPNMLGNMMRNLDTFSARLSTSVVDVIQADLKKRNVPF